MKNQTKAVIASIVVIALALTAVSGITYSWFSDTEKADVAVSTAKVDYGVTFEPSKVSGLAEIKAGTEEGTFVISKLVANAEMKVTCKITNDSTIATKYKVVVTPVLSDGSTFTTYDLVNVQINGDALAKSDLNKGKDVVSWSNEVSVGATINDVVINITTPKTYGGEPEDNIMFDETTGAVSDTGTPWNAKTERNGLVLEFKVIAVQSDYETTTTP